MRRLIGILTSLMLGLGSLIILGALGTAPAYAKDLDCDNFNTQADAQHYFNDHGGGPNNNFDLLDSDGDGIACESNPCPCTTGGGGGGGNNPPAPPKPSHKLSARGAEVGNTNKFIAVGRVTTFKDGRISVLLNVAGGAYRAYKLSRTNKSTGKFRAGIKQQRNKKTCFKVVVPETKTYRKTEKVIGCITS